MQVTNVGLENGIAEVKLAEMVTGDVSLRYLHRETREVLDEGNTRPEIIMQQLCTRKGQVRWITPPSASWTGRQSILTINIRNENVTEGRTTAMRPMWLLGHHSVSAFRLQMLKGKNMTDAAIWADHIVKWMLDTANGSSGFTDCGKSNKNWCQVNGAMVCANSTSLIIWQ